MVFTESDAQNDGLIKREVGREMAKVAQTQNPQLYEYFIQVCEEIGRDPQDIFGEMAVRSLNSEEYSERVFNSEVNMRDLQADSIRVDDVKYVQELTEQLGINESEEKEDPIDALIQQRLQSVSSSPLGQFNQAKTAQAGVRGEAMEYMEKMENRMRRMEEKITSGDQQNNQTVEKTTEESKKSVDDLFGGDGEQEEPSEPEPEPERPTVQTVSGSGDVETGEEEHDIGEKPSEEEIEQAMDGVVGEVEEDNRNPREDLDMSIDIPSEQETGEEGFYTSEDGEEE